MFHNKNIDAIVSRLLYVRAPNLVNVNLGPRYLAKLVGLGQLFIAFGSTLWFGEGDARSRAAINMCLSPDILEQVILYLPNGRKISGKDSRYIKLCCIILGILT